MTPTRKHLTPIVLLSTFALAACGCDHPGTFADVAERAAVLAARGVPGAADLADVAGRLADLG